MSCEREVMTLAEKRITGPTRIDGPPETAYLDLKRLATYCSCSIRWIRDRLVDRVHPLPHYRIGGKLLVKRDEFDQWMTAQRVVQPGDQVSQIVDSVIAQVRPGRLA